MDQRIPLSYLLAEENLKAAKNTKKKMLDAAAKMRPTGDQFFYGHGKLLLSGEYFVLDGAKSLALPTSVGQSMSVKYRNNFKPKLHWKSFDADGKLWFETEFEFWHFNFLRDINPSQEELFLQKLLRQARLQNRHFLRDEVDIQVETYLDFPLSWGLGSSSTLIYNIAQWAYISPFQLLFKTYGGSGYDIACAQSDGPIFYTKKGGHPVWTPIDFCPLFKGQLYFVYLGRKQNSQMAIEYYKSKRPASSQTIKKLSELTEAMACAKKLEEFEEILLSHETLIAKELALEKASTSHFKGYWGQTKSLGAWGGDFILATSNRSKEETKKYFLDLGYPIILPYEKIILEHPHKSPMKHAVLEDTFRVH